MINRSSNTLLPLISTKEKEDMVQRKNKAQNAFLRCDHGFDAHIRRAGLTFSEIYPEKKRCKIR